MLLRFAPVLFVLLWSSGFIGTKLAVTGAEPFTFLSIRFALVLAILTPISYVLAKHSLSLQQRLSAFGAGVLLHAGYLGGVTWGVSAGMDANVTALMCALQPILTAVFAGLTLGETISGRHWSGLALGLVGTALVILPKFGPAATAGFVNVADALPAFLSVAFAVLAITAGTIYQKRYASRIELIPGVIWQYIGAFAVVAPLSFLFETQRVNWTPSFVFALFWLVFVLSLGAITLLMLLIRENAVSRTSALFYLVPSVTSVMAFAFFGETLSPVQIAGFAIVTFAVIWLQKPPIPTPPTQS